MKVVIRPAIPEDANAITRIAEACFRHDFDCERVRFILQTHHSRCFVAERAGTIAGFVDCFLSQSPLDESRLELDLLAVDELARGLGIGKRLVEQCSLLAATLRIDLVRALVRTDNDAMQRLMESCGYVRSHDLFRLYIANHFESLDATPSTHRDNLINVYTLGYSGIWIEGTIGKELIQASLAQATDDEVKTVGAVVNARETEAQTLLSAFGFIDSGSFHWWTLTQRSGQS